MKKYFRLEGTVSYKPPPDISSSSSTGHCGPFPDFSKSLQIEQKGYQYSPFVQAPGAAGRKNRVHRNQPSEHLMTTFAIRIQPSVQREITAAGAAEASGHFVTSFQHLERAHVLGQAATAEHACACALAHAAVCAAQQPAQRGLRSTLAARSSLHLHAPGSCPNATPAALMSVAFGACQCPKTYNKRSTLPGRQTHRRPIKSCFASLLQRQPWRGLPPS